MYERAGTPAMVGVGGETAATDADSEGVAAPAPPVPAKRSAHLRTELRTDSRTENGGAAAGQAAESTALDIDALARAAEQTLQDIRATEHPAPLLSALSQQRKDSIPTLMYLRHDYRGDEDSSVTINGQQARIGDTVGRGVRVEEILPDAVVLRHDGQVFRLRALNSWVNL